MMLMLGTVVFSDMLSASEDSPPIIGPNLPTANHCIMASPTGATCSFRTPSSYRRQTHNRSKSASASHESGCAQFPPPQLASAHLPVDPQNIQEPLFPQATARLP